MSFCPKIYGENLEDTQPPRQSLNLFLRLYVLALHGRAAHLLLLGRPLDCAGVLRESLLCACMCACMSACTQQTYNKHCADQTIRLSNQSKDDEDKSNAMQRDKGKKIREQYEVDRHKEKQCCLNSMHTYKHSLKFQVLNRFILQSPCGNNIAIRKQYCFFYLKCSNGQRNKRRSLIPVQKTRFICASMHKQGQHVLMLPKVNCHGLMICMCAACAMLNALDKVDKVVRR